MRRRVERSTRRRIIPMIRAAHLFGLGILAILAGLLMVAAPEHALAQAVRTISNVATPRMGRAHCPPAHRVEPRRHAARVAGGHHVGAVRACRRTSSPRRCSTSSCAAHAPRRRRRRSPTLALRADHAAHRRPVDRARGRSPRRQSRRDGRRDDQPLRPHRPRRRGTSRVRRDRRRTAAASSPSSARPPRAPSRPATAASPCRRRLRNHFRFSDTAGGPVVTEFAIDVLVDPYGIAFDSRDGTPVGGVRITIVDVGHRPAGAGVRRRRRLDLSVERDHRPDRHRQRRRRSMRSPPGDYRFPLAPPRHLPAARRAGVALRFPVGRHAPRSSHCCVAPTAARSRSCPAPMATTSSSSDPAPVRVDIPLDRPLTPIVVIKTAVARRGRERRPRPVSRDRPQSRRRADRRADRQRPHSRPDAASPRQRPARWSAPSPIPSSPIAS